MSDIAMGESRYEDLNICWIDRTISLLPTLAEGGADSTSGFSGRHMKPLLLSSLLMARLLMM